MDRKVIYAIAVVAILVVASVGVYFVMSKDRGADDSPSSLDGAELKVFGNINGDRYLDADDADMIGDLIAQGATAEEYPLADANRDGVIDSKDVDVVTAVAEGRDTTIWHVNYHDVDGDSVMEEEIVASHFPVRSVIISASANISMHLFSIGIIDEVKGAAYTDGTLDDVLYGSNYLDTSKVTKIGESVTNISLEDGQMGASDVIAQHDVTALITDWNQNYITNENDFENAGVDVIRVSCNSVDPVDMTHTMMLLGLLFQKVDRAEAYLDLNLEILDYAVDSVAGQERSTFVASTMKGRISSGTSDYSTILELAGGEFGLKNVDFGTANTIKISEHPEVYLEDFDYILHMRTTLGYSQDMEQVKSDWDNYTSAFSDWEHAETGQYLVSNSIATPLKVAYAASVLHPDCVDLDRVNELHQQLVDQFFNGVELDISEMMFVVSAQDMA